MNEGFKRRESSQTTQTVNFPSPSSILLRRLPGRWLPNKKSILPGSLGLLDQSEKTPIKLLCEGLSPFNLLVSSVSVFNLGCILFPSSHHCQFSYLFEFSIISMFTSTCPILEPELSSTCEITSSCHFSTYTSCTT